MHAYMYTLLHASRTQIMHFTNDQIKYTLYLSWTCRALLNQTVITGFFEKDEKVPA